MYDSIYISKIARYERSQAVDYAHFTFLTENGTHYQLAKCIESSHGGASVGGVVAKAEREGGTPRAAGMSPTIWQGAPLRPPAPKNFTCIST